MLEYMDMLFLFYSLCMCVWGGAGWGVYRIALFWRKPFAVVLFKFKNFYSFNEKKIQQN